MSLKCGIIGLPNVGKSTLFNALTESSCADAANYPFCTIEPNTGVVSVPDDRLTQLAKIEGSQKIIPTTIEFVDIAGLVKGASKGEGLGNSFLGHIREVDAIIHVIRCFDDLDITHVHGVVNPLADLEIIDTELMLADLASAEKQLTNMEKKFKSGDKSLKSKVDLLKECIELLGDGRPASGLIGKYDYEEIKTLQLLTAKPVLYVCNVLESEAATGNKYSEIIANKAKEQNLISVVISSKVESEIVELDTQEEKDEFLASMGLKETGLSKIIKLSYDLLNLRSFFTVGPKEARAWTFKNGTVAPEAAGIIHTDFQAGFIRAEAILADEYIKIGNLAKAKDLGKVRVEGKDYKVQDGDVVHFRFNV